MMRYVLLLPILIIGGCTLFSPTVAPPENLAAEVNPFIGTGGHGQTRTSTNGEKQGLKRK